MHVLCTFVLPAVRPQAYGRMAANSGPRCFSPAQDIQQRNKATAVQSEESGHCELLPRLSGQNSSILLRIMPSDKIQLFFVEIQ